MPLSVNVGLSRKASKDFQSIGCSISLTAELDQALLARPQDLQQQIEELYAQARQALDQQSAPQFPAGAVPPPAASPLRHAHGSNGHGNGNGSRSDTPMTLFQRRAIEGIARRLGIDPEQEARDLLGEELTSLVFASGFKTDRSLPCHRTRAREAGVGMDDDNRAVEGWMGPPLKAPDPPAPHAPHLMPRSSR